MGLLLPGLPPVMPGSGLNGLCRESWLDFAAPGEVAQSVEHTAENRGVAGSIPALAIFRRRDRHGGRGSRAAPEPDFRRWSGGLAELC